MAINNLSEQTERAGQTSNASVQRPGFSQVFKTNEEYERWKSTAVIAPRDITILSQVTTLVLPDGHYTADDVLTAAIMARYVREFPDGQPTDRELTVVRTSEPQKITEYQRSSGVLVANIGHGAFDQMQGDRHIGSALVYEKIKNQMALAPVQRKNLEELMTDLHTNVESINGDEFDLAKLMDAAQQEMHQDAFMQSVELFDRFFDTTDKLVHSLNTLEPDSLKTTEPSVAERICVAVVKQDGSDLQYIPQQYQTRKVCKTALSQSGYNLAYIKHQTPEICYTAIADEPMALQYVKEQTPDICRYAIEKNPLAIQAIRTQTPELGLAAVQRDPSAAQYLTVMTPEIYNALRDQPEGQTILNSPFFPELQEMITDDIKRQADELRLTDREQAPNSLDDVLRYGYDRARMDKAEPASAEKESQAKADHDPR